MTNAVNSYYEVKDAAALLHYSPLYVRRMCRSGKLKADRFGLKWLIHKDALNAMIVKQDKAIQSAQTQSQPEAVTVPEAPKPAPRAAAPAKAEPQAKPKERTFLDDLYGN